MFGTMHLMCSQMAASALPCAHCHIFIPVHYSVGTGQETASCANTAFFSSRDRTINNNCSLTYRSRNASSQTHVAVALRQPSSQGFAHRMLGQRGALRGDGANSTEQVGRV